ncbi:MAG: hypothetical protein DRN81_06240 [Thermoproteota archaeon]|nr:MAG: hypothetical protein DRN81_06240 [Candidatus Korarchaeota archaeon]
MKGKKREGRVRNEARLMFRHVCVETRELDDIPVRINLPCLQYINDPLEIPPVKVYNLVFELKEIRTEDDVNVIIYRFMGIEEVK